MGCCNEGGVCESSVHDAGKLDPAWWLAQRFIGVQDLHDPDICLELRNCCALGCDSTLSMPVPLTEERAGIILEQNSRAEAFRKQVDAARAQYAQVHA